jgi:membrane protein implicated in regulation of membrane protease activity
MKTDHFWIVLLVVMLLVTGVADMMVEHGFYLWVFTIVIWLLLRSIASGGVSWFYVFMVLFIVYCLLFIVYCLLFIFINHHPLRQSTPYAKSLPNKKIPYYKMQNQQ